MSETNAEGQHPREGAEPVQGGEADYVGPVDHGDEKADSGEDGEAEKELEPDGTLTGGAEHSDREADPK